MGITHRYSRCAFLAALLTFAAGAGASAGTAFQQTWYPDGIINWFVDDVTNAGTGNVNITTAMDFLSSRTPVRQTQVFSRNAANLRFSRGAVLPGNSGMTAFYWQQGRNDQRKVIELGDTGTVGVRTVLHEVGHALGFAHEFQRPERTNFVTMCVYADGFNFGRIGRVPLTGPHWNLSPYDHVSIMNSGYSCQSPSPSIPNRLSRHDINSIYRMYAQPLGPVGAGDRFGHSVAVGDFDGDGIEDIAVAAAETVPGEIGGTTGWVDLRVYLFRGVMTDPTEEPGAGTSYVSWFREDVRQVRANDPRLVLHSGDFNGDGIDDLAVGEPYFFGDRGRVSVWFVNVTNDASDTQPPWGRRGVRRVVSFNSPAVGLGTAPVRFGAALTSGRLTAEKTASLQVTPDDLIIGAPAADTGGAVVLLQGMVDPTGDAWAPAATILLENPNAQTGDAFGFAVSVIPGMCETDGMDKDVVVVGAPGDADNSGAIYVFGCASDASHALVTPPLVRRTAHHRDESRYGAAVAGFRTRSSASTSFYKYYVAIGAPEYRGGGENPDSGIVYLDQIERDGTKTFITSYRPGTRSGGDRFGAAIAVHQKAFPSNPTDGNRTVRIAIGMPGTQVDGIVAGKVYIWRPWDSLNEPLNTAVVEEPVRVSTDFPALFGADIAVLRNFEDTGGFVVGAPGAVETTVIPFPFPPRVQFISSGAVDVILNRDTRPVSWRSERRHITQRTAADRQPVN